MESSYQSSSNCSIAQVLLWKSLSDLFYLTVEASYESFIILIPTQINDTATQDVSKIISVFAEAEFGRQREHDTHNGKEQILFV